MALGTFSNIQLAEQQFALENLWAEPQKSKNYTPYADSLKAVLEQQTAMLTPLEDPNYEYDFRVKWVDHAAETPAAITQNDDCTNTKGSEGTGKTKTYALDYKKAVTFSVERDQLEKSFIGAEEMIATGQAAKIKDLIEDFNATIPAALDANRATPTAALAAGATGWTSDAGVDKQIEIVTAQWSFEKMIPQLLRNRRLLRNRSAMILDGGSLFNEYYTALRQYANADGKTAGEMLADIPYRHDLDAFAAASLSDSFFLVDPGTIAIANRAKYPSIENARWTQGASGNYLRYSIPVNIPSLPGMVFVTQGGMAKQSLMLDVQYSIVCDGGKEYDTWRMILRAGVFFNPTRLAATNTGINKYTKVA